VQQYSIVCLQKLIISCCPTHTHTQAMLDTSQRNNARRHKFAAQRMELKSRQGQSYYTHSDLIDVSQTTAAAHLRHSHAPTVFADADEVANEVLRLTKELGNYKLQHRMARRELEAAHTRSAALYHENVAKLETIQRLEAFVREGEEDAGPRVCGVCSNQDRVKDTLEAANKWTTRRLVQAEKMAEERLQTVHRLGTRHTCVCVCVCVLCWTTSLSLLLLYVFKIRTHAYIHPYVLTCVTLASTRRKHVEYCAKGRVLARSGGRHGDCSLPRAAGTQGDKIRACGAAGAVRKRQGVCVCVSVYDRDKVCMCGRERVCA
jgi:hypothetical protein